MKQKIKLIPIANLVLILTSMIINFSFEVYIKIPFKIYKEPEPNKFTIHNDYFNYWKTIMFVGEISIGTPGENIQVIFNFDDYGLHLINKGTNITLFNSKYNHKNSSTYKESSNTSPIYFSKYSIGHYVFDTFIFNDNNSKCDGIQFLLSADNNNKTNSFLSIGLNYMGNILRDSEINIVKQLKKLRFIDSYDWSIEFNETNPENNGIFLIGTEPHIYNPSKYNEDNYFNGVTLSDPLLGYWNLKVDKIFFNSIDDINEEILVKDYLTLSLIPNSGLIKGTKEYKNLIKKHFFSPLISSKKCYEDKNGDISSYFVCYNSPSIKKELKLKFPTLKLVKKSFLYTFQLTYDDLFREKDDKIYFLVWFSGYTSSWQIGFPFMKKYFFNYNYDSKMISFYNNNSEDQDFLNKNKDNILIKLCLIIVFTIIIALLCFYIGKKYVLSNKKKKLNAKELESEFSSTGKNKLLQL